MENNNNNENKIIHTLSKDVSFAIESNKDGLIKKIIKEEEKKEEEKKEQLKNTKKNRIYLFLTILFIIFSLSIFFYIFISKENNIFQFKKNNSLIFHEEYTTIEINDKKKDEFFSLISKEVMSFSQEENTIKGIYLVENKKPIKMERLLSLIDSRVFVKEGIFNNFLIGIIKNKKVEEEIIPEIIEEEPKEILDDFITLSTSAFFKTGTTEFSDIKAEEKAKRLIGYFLDTISLDDTKIKVIGTFSIERPWEKNEKLAEERKTLGLRILNDVLKERYKEEDINKIIIEPISKGLSLEDIYTKDEIEKMGKEEKDLKIDLNQGIQYLAEAKKKSEIAEEKEIDILIEEEIKEEKIDSIYPKSNDLFILFKVNKLEDIFSIIKSWETDMFVDLHRFFGMSISSETKYLTEKDFEDGVVHNKNARILYDIDRQIVFMYVFIDENFVIITRNPDTVKEVLLRINSSKIKK